MGRRYRAQVQARAEAVIAAHGRDVAGVMGLPWPQPDVTVRVSASATVPGSTNGLTITLGERWFREHPDDDGCVLHELSHAYLRAPEYSPRTAWLIEGVADHVRDVLGFSASWTFARFEPGMATAGYQTTAHFLAWLEARWPGTVAGLCGRLADGTYEEGTFAELCGPSLASLVERYEQDVGGGR
jgi:hypothetical protein